jgi:opacity protein-like surface antigen
VTSRVFSGGSQLLSTDKCRIRSYMWKALSVILIAASAFVALSNAQTAAPWQTQKFVAVENTVGQQSTDWNAHSWAQQLCVLLAGSNYATAVNATVDVRMEGRIYFALATPSGLAQLYRTKILELSPAELTELEVTGVWVAGTEPVATPPPDTDQHNEWIIGVVIGGLAIAGASVAFAEYKARSARARRRVRAQQQSTLQEGMLSDN